MQDVETRLGGNQINTKCLLVGILMSKVESYLCVGGPVAYKIVERPNVTFKWLYNNAVPGMFAHYGLKNTICEVLVGLALLWTCHEETQQF
jgi:hypothetical protein